MHFFIVSHNFLICFFQFLPFILLLVFLVVPGGFCGRENYSIFFHFQDKILNLQISFFLWKSFPVFVFL